jgi:hypothetical protein
MYETSLYTNKKVDKYRHVNLCDKKFTYMVRAYIPISMMCEQRLKDSLQNLQYNVSKYAEKIEQIEKCKNRLKKLTFDIDKDKERKLLDCYKKELLEIEVEMNKGISPYSWDMIRNPNPDIKRAWNAYLVENGELIL